MANNVALDQMPHSVASDLDLHCKNLSIPVLRVITVIIVNQFYEIMDGKHAYL